MKVNRDEMVVGEIYTYDFGKGVYTVATLKESYEPEKRLLVNLTTMNTELLKLVISSKCWTHHPEGALGFKPTVKLVEKSKPETKKPILSLVHKCPQCGSAVEALLCINFTLIKCHQCGYKDGV